jgi:hypothetical protein
MKVTIKTAHNTYIRAGDDGRTIDQADISREWEQFELEEVTSPGPGPGPGPKLVDPKTATAAFLYPGTNSRWLWSERAMRAPITDIDEHLAVLEREKIDCCVVNCNLGVKNSVRSLKFDMRQSVDQAHERMAYISARMPILAFCFNPEFFWQTLDEDFKKLGDVAELTTRELTPYVSAWLFMWESGKVFNGSLLTQKAEAIRRMRRGTEIAGRGDVYILDHERAGEEVTRDTFKKIDESRSGSALQSGFGRTLHGWFESGGHRYRGVVGFMKNSVRRWGGYNRGHIVKFTEGTIPRIYSGQPWKPTHTWPWARTFSRDVVRLSKCDGDWNAGTQG